MNILKNRNRGFTLIELLVVIAIIGILSAIVFVNVGAARKKAKDISIKADFASLANLAQDYYDINGAYCVLNGEGVCDGETFCTDSNVASIMNTVDQNAAYGDSGCGVTSDGSNYCLCGKLNYVADKAWWVESTGKKMEVISIGTGICDTSLFFWPDDICPYII